MTWEYKQSPGPDYIENRSNHVATIISNNLVVQGGISEYGKIFNDTWLLNLSSFSWELANIKFNPVNK